MAIAAAAVAVVGGVASAVVSAKQAKKARNAIKNYKRQELTNAYKDVTIETRGAQLQREELARSSATSINALRQGGIRGVVGGVGQVQQANVLQSRVIGADLERQQKQIDQLKASDEVRIQQTQEAREQADLAGLGQQLQAGRQGVMNGIGMAAQGVGSMAGAMGGSGGGQQANTMGQGFDYKMPSAGSFGAGSFDVAAPQANFSGAGGNPFLGTINSQNAFNNVNYGQVGG